MITSRSRRLLQLAVGLAALGAVAVAQAGEWILGAAEVQQAVSRGAQLWDVRDAKDSLKAHLPGSLNMGNPAVLLRDKTTEDFVSVERIREYFSEAGLDDAKEIIVYGNRGSWLPYFAQFTLNHFGAERVRVFHGGIEEWQAAGLPLETGKAQAAPITDFKVQINPSRSIGTSELVSNTSNFQIIDARTAKEYRGEDIRAAIGGHVPGALNIPYEQNWADPDAASKIAKGDSAAAIGMSLKSTSDLERIYNALDKAKETVVYCQSGARASETAGILRDLGFTKVRVYDSSWIGYAVSGAPVSQAKLMNTALLEQELERWRQENAEMRLQLQIAPSQAELLANADPYYGSLLWAQHRAAAAENKALRQQLKSAKTL